MTLKAAFQHARLQLAGEYRPREADIVAGMVLEAVTGWDRLGRLTHAEFPLSEAQQKDLQEKLKALAEGMPIQYVLGEAWFYGLSFYVGPEVLIPRPETEELVSWILEDHLPHAGVARTLIDIGTGSGCLAVALKKNRPDFRIIALEHSAAALTTAARNAERHGTPLTFLQADILDPATYGSLPALDIIVSNPPYIPLHEKPTLQRRVSDYEPGEALFVPDADPERFYRAVLDVAETRLSPGGAVYVEIHADHGEAVMQLFGERGFLSVSLRQDLSGRDRMIRGRKSS
jgi:release factor glutamine methyltransferase